MAAALQPVFLCRHMRSIIIILFFGVFVSAYAQDSTMGSKRVLSDHPAPSDSLLFRDSLQLLQAEKSIDTAKVWADAWKEVIGMSGFQLTAPGWFFLQREKEEVGREQVFYYLLFLFLFFGALKVGYPRYFTDAYRYYFQSTLRIHQVKEQLSHAASASFLFNLLYFFSAGAYLYLLTDYYQLSFKINNAWLPVVTFLTLLLIYAGKYLFLSVFGWAFGIQKAASVYLFITFLTNKLMGIALLPLLPCIAFIPNPLVDFFVMLSFIVIILFYAYRLFRAYQPLHEEYKIGFWQYVLYLLAFEIVPLLLIYKLLINIL